MPRFTRFPKAVLATCVALSSLFIGALPAHAADAPVDLMVMSVSVMDDRLNADVVCNTGSSNVISITFDSDFVGVDIVMTQALPNGLASVTATNFGEYDTNTQVWTGVLAGGECMAVGRHVNPTVAVGETYSHDVSIVSSVLGDSTANVDPNSANDAATFTSAPKINVSDFAISTRLLTEGPVTAGSTISYDVTITNEGLGSYIDSPSNDLPIGLYFLVPPGASIGTITDNLPSDELAIDNCGSMGDTSLLGPGIAAYSGTIAGCTFVGSSPLLPGSSYSFTVPFTLGTDFVSGVTQIYGAVSVADAESMMFQVYRLNGTPVFSLPSNHISSLIYNGDELQVTINRCPGQSETTSDGTGCFRVSFSKLIYAPSFEVGDLVLNGDGRVTSFEQLDDFTWEVRVSDISPGATLSLLLGTGSVQDWNAISNGTQVLGANSIRFAVANDTNGTASGISTLPATGASGSDAVVPMLLILFGLLLVKLSKRQFAS